MNLVTVNKPELIKNTVRIAADSGITTDDAAGMLLLDYDHSINKNKMSVMAIDLDKRVIEAASNISQKLKIDINTVYVYWLIKCIDEFDKSEKPLKKKGKNNGKKKTRRQNHKNKNQ
jgi:hypothetical protein